jgi:hypothetical protein
MNKLVDEVLGAQPAGVEDRRSAKDMVGDDADQAVPDSAPLIADRQG